MASFTTRNAPPLPLKVVLIALGLAVLTLSCLRNEQATITSTNDIVSTRRALREARKLQFGLPFGFGIQQPSFGRDPNVVTATVSGEASLNNAAGSGGRTNGGLFAAQGGTSGLGQGNGRASSPFINGGSEITASGVAGGKGTTTSSLATTGTAVDPMPTGTVSANTNLVAGSTFGGSFGNRVGGMGTGTGTLTTSSIGTGSDTMGGKITAAGAATGDIFAGGQGVAISSLGSAGGTGSGISKANALGGGDVTMGTFVGTGAGGGNFDNSGSGYYGSPAAVTFPGSSSTGFLKLPSV